MRLWRTFNIIEWLIVIALALTILLLVNVPAKAADVVLLYDRALELTDGRPLAESDIRSTRAYCVAAGGMFSSAPMAGEVGADGDITVTLPDNTNQDCVGTHTICLSNDGTYNASVPCNGPGQQVIESAISNLVSITVGSPPGPPPETIPEAPTNWREGP